MEINIEYNDNVHHAFDERKLKTVDFKKFIDETTKTYTTYYMNIVKFKNNAEKLIMMKDIALKNLNKEVYTNRDFKSLEMLLMITNGETNNYLMNGKVVKRFYDKADKESIHTVEWLKEVCINILLQFDLFNMEINNELKKINRISEMCEFIQKGYRSCDADYKKIAIICIDYIATKIIESETLNDDKRKSLSNIVGIIKSINNKVQSNCIIDYEMVKPLFDMPVESNINFEYILSKENIDAYNEEVKKIEDEYDDELIFKDQFIKSYESLEKIISMARKRKSLYSEIIKKLLKCKTKNIKQANLTKADFNIIKKLAVLLDNEAIKYFKNDDIPNKDLEDIMPKMNYAYSLLYNDLYKSVSKYINNQTIFMQKLILQDFKDMSDLSEMFDVIIKYYHSNDDFSYSVAYCMLLRILINVEESVTIEMDSIDVLISLIKDMRKVYISILNNEEVSYDDIENLFKSPFDLIELRLSSSREMVESYNRQVRTEKKIKQEILNESLLQREKAKNNQLEENIFEEAKIELTEEDMVCLQLYLEIVTDLASGKIKIEDFENKTANYISYVEGTHYKEILEELIIKIQNSTNISKNIKTKGIKAINALKS